MQVSSVASEPSFSTSDRILDPYRSCLTHYMIEVLMCTIQWMKSEHHLGEKGMENFAHMIAEIEDQDKLEKDNIFQFLVCQFSVCFVSLTIFCFSNLV